MKKLALAILSLSLLAGCAAMPPKKSPEEIRQAQQAAAKAFSQCAAANVASLDDGVSDASTIAFALTLHCTSEYDNALNAMAADLEDTMQVEQFKSRAKNRARQIEASLPVVLAYRNAQKLKTAK